MICRSGVPILNGGSYSNILGNPKHLSISNTLREYLIPLQKIKKDNQLESRMLMELPIKDGMLFI
jgi:hypothetical protein